MYLPILIAWSRYSFLPVCQHREPFRPFAPTVIEEEQYEYFDLMQPSPYMLLATTVKEKYRAKLSAITHIDNTARVQSVSKENEPFIHKLLLELKNRTGFPIVLNTSFNAVSYTHLYSMHRKLPYGY